jgi:hypothetical protein
MSMWSFRNGNPKMRRTQPRGVVAKGSEAQIRRSPPMLQPEDNQPGETGETDRDDGTDQPLARGGG